jgi:hypothetical protein
MPRTAPRTLVEARARELDPSAEMTTALATAKDS